ncbi:MAG: hypothetical protein ACI38Q_05855 [Candidatus Bruticola sp.]
MNNIHKFVAVALFVGVCAAPLSFMSATAQAQNYPKAGQYYPKSSSYPKSAGKSAPQTVENADGQTTETMNSAPGSNKSQSRSEDNLFYNRYGKTVKAWQVVEGEIRGGQRDLSSYEDEVLKRNHRNLAVLWCMLYKDLVSTQEHVSRNQSTLSDKAFKDIRSWLGSLYFLVNTFEDEMKSRNFEFDSYESIKREQGVKE